MLRRFSTCFALVAIFGCSADYASSSSPTQTPDVTTNSFGPNPANSSQPLATAWILSPNYGQAFNNATTQPIIVSGYARVPNASVTINVLDPADQNPAAAISSWTTLGQGLSSSTGTTVYGETLYPWSVSVQVVADAVTSVRWPSGGLAHLQAVVNNAPADSFDASFQACAALFAGTKWSTIAADCSMHLSYEILVDNTSQLPQRQENFLLFPSTQTNVFSANVQETVNYYNQLQIRANGTDTLQHFRNTYGLAPGGTNLTANSNEIFAIYYNHGDLGFGREMHCGTAPNGGGAIGCYVTNYGTPGGPSDTALTQAIARQNPVATVAMEYKPGAVQNPITFMVYDGNGNILNLAALDSQGAKPTPIICLTCHGGTYDLNTHSISGTNFLPFDMDAFVFSTQAGFTQTDQQEAFRRLNALVLQTQPTSTIRAEINGWYGALGVNTVGSAPNVNWVPPGWANEAALYNNVVRPYCRSCHNSLPAPTCWPTAADFFTYGSAIEASVCTGPVIMPASEQTTLHFWSSGARAYLIDALNVGTSCSPL